MAGSRHARHQLPADHRHREGAVPGAGPAVPDARHRARPDAPAGRCSRSTTSPTSTSSSAGSPRTPRKRLVRFMAKREVFDHSIGGPVMRSMHHISVDRADGGASMDEALRYLQAGEVVGIFPEATISPVLRGQGAEVRARPGSPPRPAYPLHPGGAVGHPAADDQGPPARLLPRQDHRDPGRRADVPDRRGPGRGDRGAARRGCRRCSTRPIDAYPADEQPPGSWWLPASRGGSAPTPERAAELDAEEKAARAARKAKPSAARRAGRDQDGDPAVG